MIINQETTSIKVDIIILSNTNNDLIYNMNLDCINSLLDTADRKYLNQVILIESNKQENYVYPDIVKKIKPLEVFHFHRFVNIGLKESKSEFIAICNNDLIFTENWFSEILKIKNIDPNIMSFSPVDPYNKNVNYNKYGEIDYFLGYNIRSEIAGWCIVVDRKILKIKNLFDNRYSFYFADNDYSMTLRKNSIKNALVLKSIVYHLGSKNSNTISLPKDKFYNVNWSQNDLLNINNQWIVSNQKMLEGYLLFHKKWGTQKSISIRKSISNKITNKVLTCFLFLELINYICSIPAIIDYRKFLSFYK